MASFVSGGGGGSSTNETIIATYLPSTGWEDGVYDGFEQTYSPQNYDLEIEPNGDLITNAQYKKWAMARLVGSVDGNKLKALGTPPDENIPVYLKVVSK